MAFAREVIDTPVTEEMSDSFLSYSLSVITSRAIPDVRDGFKPVQRRILFSMYKLGLRPDGAHRKCAGVVGDTMGKYHPHGDSAIYDALVRLGWDFARNVTMVDPHGNFGSLDDPPAAYRYTECRPTTAAMDMLGEIVEETVDFRPTFDGLNDEPVYLPGLVPNLLVNGTAGIAVGMATNMAPHNLREVSEAIKLVMTQRRPKVTLDQVMEVLPGPDFPSGGMIIDESLRDAYESGRGAIRIRAKATVEKVGRRKEGIIITELPYMVGPEKVVARVKELIAKGKLANITDVNDLSDRTNGLRVVIECRAGSNPHAILNDLYRLTPLEESFSFNNVVLVNDRPTTVGIIELCQHYIDHRLDVVQRRTQYRLDKALARAHIVEGLLIALDAIDEVIAIIRSSADSEEASTRLQADLALSEIQAEHILEMQLRRLTALEVQKLIDELVELRKRIAEYEKILGSEKRQRTIVLKELEDIVKKYGVERRSRILTDAEVEAAALEVPVAADVIEEACTLAITTSGLIGRQSADGAAPAKPGRHDVLAAAINASTTAEVTGITSNGRMLRVAVADIPEVAGRSRGAAVSEIFDIARGERLIGVFGADGDPVMLVTAGGVAKRLERSELFSGRSGSPAIKLKGDDTVAAAFSARADGDAMIVASDGQTLRLAVDAINTQGRSAAGVAGMKLKGAALVVAAGAVSESGVIITATSGGRAKSTPVSEFEAKGRGGSGLRITKLPKGEEILVARVAGPHQLTGVFGSADDPAKPDPTPKPLDFGATKRDGTGTAIHPPLLAVGEGRW